MAYLLDTNICVFFLRGKLDLDAIFKKVGIQNCYISEITVAELRFGAEKSNSPVKSHKAVDNFVNGLTIIPVFGCIPLYAIEKARLEKAGTPMHDDFDLFIGVTAVENQLVLVTDNTKDFIRLNGIQLENWFRNPN